MKAYSEIAKQFRYFKDAWRNGLAHSRDSYNEEQPLSIFRQVKDFVQDIEKLGLKENLYAQHQLSFFTSG